MRAWYERTRLVGVVGDCHREYSWRCFRRKRRAFAMTEGGVKGECNSRTGGKEGRGLESRAFFKRHHAQLIDAGLQGVYQKATKLADNLVDVVRLEGTLAGRETGQSQFPPGPPRADRPHGSGAGRRSTAHSPDTWRRGSTFDGGTSSRGQTFCQTQGQAGHSPSQRTSSPVSSRRRTRAPSAVTSGRESL